MKLIRICLTAFLIFVLILLHIGLDTTTPSSTPKNEIQRSDRSDMSFTEFDTTMTSTKDLTTLQKENLYQEMSHDKIYRWEGKVIDVTQNMVIIDVMRDVNYRNSYDVNNYYFKTLYYDDSKIMVARLGRAKIQLHITDDQKSEMDSISKDRIISFEGTMTNESIGPVDNYKRKKSSGIDLYNGRIIEFINSNSGITV